MVTLPKSPFSKARNWRISWRRIPSSYKRLINFHPGNEREHRAITALAHTGLISSKHLRDVFRIDKEQQKKMEKGDKIVRHTIQSDNLTIPMYSLGENGAIIAGLHDMYESNYWVEYQTNDVLKRFLFFEYFNLLKQRFPDIQTVATPKPFVAGIQFSNGDIMYVYVAKGDTSDMQTYLKWGKKSINNQIMVVIGESLVHVDSFKMFLEGLRVRILIEDDLFTQHENFNDYFYLLNDEGIFIKETER